MKGCKVIRKDRMSACSVSGCCNDWIVTYPKGIEVKPTSKGSKLFFFTNKKDAEEFAFFRILKISHQNIVVPCIAKGVSKPKYICSLSKNYSGFWQSRSKYKGFLMKVPHGTRLADSITCLE